MLRETLQKNHDGQGEMLARSVRDPTRKLSRALETRSV